MFNLEKSGLADPGATYYVRPYCYNSEGYGYGSVYTVTLSTSPNIMGTNNARWVGYPAGTSFSAIRSGAELTVYDPTGSNPDNLQGPQESQTASPWLFRAFFYFCIVGLTTDFDGLKLKVYSYESSENAYATLVGADLDFPKPTTSDWLSVNNQPTKLADDFSISGLPTGQYVEITLNAAGVAYVKAAIEAGDPYVMFVMLTKNDYDNNLGVTVRDFYWFFYLTQETDKEPFLEFENYGAKFYPSWDLSRVTAIRHIYRSGSYRLEATLGDVSTSVELAQRTVQIPSVVPAKEDKGKRTEPVVTEVTVPERTAPELVAALRDEGLFPASDRVTAPQPPAPIIRTEPSLWQRLTPWREEAGETFPSEVQERVESLTKTVKSFWQTITPWKEEAGETFGSKVQERVDKITGWFKGLF